MDSKLSTTNSRTENSSLTEQTSPNGNNVIVFRKNRFAHMQVCQLEILARNNTLKRQIFVDLIKNTNFAAHGSKFYRLYEIMQKGRTIPCFQATTCRREVLVRLADGEVTIGLSLKDNDFQKLWDRISPLVVYDAQILGFTLNHNVQVPESFDHLATTLGTLLDGLNVSRTIASKLISLVCKLTILFSSKFKRTVVIATLVDILVTMEIGMAQAQEIVNSISGYLRVAFNYLTNAVVAQVDQEPVVAITVILSTLVGSMLMGAIPKATQIDTCVSGVKKLGDTMRGLDSSWKVFEKIANYVFQKVFEWKEGHPVAIEEMETFITGVTEWFHEVQTLAALNTAERIAIEPETCQQIERLHATGLRYSQMATEFKLDRRIMEPFNVHWRLIQTLFDKATASGAFRSGPRIEPVVIYLFGESGVGKSGMTYPLAIELLKIDGMTEVDGRKDFTRDIYMRNPEQEYWDNYRNQRICIYDDFAQAVDSVSNPNPEFFEIIRTGNLAPYPLHMASLEQKANTFFKSRVVICTSNTNIGQIRPASIVSADAVKRRIDVCMEVRVRPEFQVDTVGEFEPQRLDPQKVWRRLGVRHSTEVYEFQPVNPIDGHNAGRPMSYRQLVRLCSRVYQNRYTRSQAIFQHLEEIAQAPRLDAQIATEELERKHQEIRNMDYGVQLVTAKQMKKWNKDTVRYFIDNLAEYNQIYSDDFREAFVPLTLIEDDDQLHEAFMTQIQNFDQVFRSPFADAWVKRRLDEHFDIYSDLLACIILDIKPTGFATILLRRLKRAATQFRNLVMHWFQDIKAKIRDHPYLTVGLITIPVVLGMMGVWFHKGKVPLTTANHTGLERGRRTKHAHVCVLCHSKYVHTHLIELEMERDSQICTKCEKNFLQIELDNYIVFENQCNRVIYAFAKEDFEHDDIRPVVISTNFTEFDKVCKEKMQFVLTNPEDHAVKMAVEIASSGDILTRKKPIVRTELAASGDIHTRKPQALRVELAKSGDEQTKKKEMIRTEANAEVATDPNCLAISKKVLNNMYNLDVLDKNQAVARMKVTFLRGRVAITAGHLRPYLEKYPYVRLWNKSKPQGHLIPTKALKLADVHGKDGIRKDQMLIEFPSVHDHADITGSIVGPNEMSKFTTTLGCLLVPCDDGAVMKYGNIRAHDSTLYYEDAKMNNRLQIRQRYEYDTFETMAGDCGSLLMAVSKTLPKKIIGLHVAGAVGIGVSSPLNIADIENAFMGFSLTAQVSVSWDDIVEEHLFADECALPEGNFTAIGKVPKGIMRAVKTELRPSLIHDVVTPHITIPAALTPQKRDGVWIDPLELGLKKAGQIPPFIDEDKMQIALRDMERVVNSNVDPEHQKILTPFEAVTGIECDPFMAPINRNTSPGYPFVFDRGNTPGKRKWLGFEEYTLDPELEKMILFRIDQAKKNIRLPTVWTDTLKDERRPIEKVKALKTRAFSAGPMDYTLAFRMYFLGFAAHVAKNRIDNEISIGTNVYSDDWTRTALRLKKKGPHVIAGDFSNFDGTLLLQVLEPMVEIVNAFYGDGEENAQVRRVLWKEICNSVHLKGDQLYLWTHSQPSGCPVTAILNSIYNSITMRYVWLDVVPEDYQTMRAFNQHVSMVSYGDDNCVNISPEVIEFFNQVTIAEGYARIGMTYTDETKSGEMIPYRSLSEIAYLKRTFVWNEEEMQYVAPLSLDTVLEMTNWIRGDMDCEQRTIDNIETSCFELSLHGREIFEKWTRKYIDATRNFRVRPMILTYDEYRKVEAVKQGRLTAAQY